MSAEAEVVIVFAAKFLAFSAAVYGACLIGLELWTYYHTEGIGVKDPTVRMDQYRQEREAALREAQIAYREQMRKERP